MKRLIPSMIVILLLCVVSDRGYAEKIRLVVNDKHLKTDADPLMRSASVFVPLRGVLEHLKSKVTYDKATGTVKARKGALSVELTVGSTKARINGSTAIMPIPAFIYKERTMVPLRFMSEALGYSVRWEPRFSTVYISSKGGSNDDVDIKDIDDTVDPDFK